MKSTTSRIVLCLGLLIATHALADETPAHWKLAPAPPAGWNSNDAFGSSVTEVESPRQSLLMDDNWQFKIGKPTDSLGKFDKVGFGPAFFKGSTVNLPHDWAVELPFADSSLRNMGYKAIGVDFRDNSIGWYAREFTIPAEAAGRRFWLEFDGVFRDCQVWVNGIYYGRHESGYSSFRYDITDVAEPGQKNHIVVRVDATLNEGWFYEGAGIYRHVWLTSTGPLAIAPDGVFVYSRFANNMPVGAAEVWAEVSLRHDLGDDTLPFVAGQIHDVPLINDQIAHLPNEVPDTAFASAQGLVTQDRSHLTPKAQCSWVSAMRKQCSN